MQTRHQKIHSPSDKGLITRRTVLVNAFAALSVLFAGGVGAQAYPSKAVRVVVPIAAGGLVDILARNITPELSRVWGQSVIVENRPGGNTILGAVVVAKSAPDGYTLLMTNPTTASMNQFLYKKLPYDAERDFQMVFNIGFAPTIMAIHPAVPANTLQEFVAYVKSRPGQVNYGSFGIGSTAHIDLELFSQRAGIRMNHIPYKGVADALPAAVAGQIELVSPGVRVALAMIKAGKLKVLSINAPRRSAALPEVPTLAEAGYPNLVMGGWFGFLAPSGVPRPIIDKIAGDIAKILTIEEVREKVLTTGGLEPLLQGPDQFTEFVREERIRYSQLIKSIKVSLD